MTVVEFFDKDSIENIVSTLLCQPDKVVFVGAKLDSMNDAIEKYKALAESRGKNVEFVPVSVTRNDLEDIINVLNRIIDENGEIEIDLTGGEDLYLVAAGVVYNSHPDKVKLHRFNINNGKLYDCDADGNVISYSPEELSVEENISIYGGRIVYDDENPRGTYRWDFNEDFISDVDIMWRICCSSTKKWNEIMKCKKQKKTKDEEESFPDTYFISANKINKIPENVKELEIYGLVSNISLSDNVLSFDCKNLQIKKCLSKSGQLLELKTAIELLKLNSSDKIVVNDILTGALIYWDNDNPDEKDVDNEVDVIVMKGLVPFFVSCKNGDVEVEELYKLNTVATHFGGKYAKKVLVATNDACSIQNRAEDMNIRVVDNLLKLKQDSKEFKKKIKSILA